MVMVAMAALVCGLGPTPAQAQRRGKKAAPAAAPAAAAPAPAPAADAGDAGRQRARELLQQGNKQLDQGLYLDALHSFEAAYAAFPSPKLHFNIAQTYNELGRLIEALHHYELFVREVKREESAQWGLANERIFKLQGSIATVQLQCNVVDAAVTVDGNVVGKTPIAAPLRFMPGAHGIVVTKAGYENQVVEINLKAGDALTQRVKLLTEEEGAATKRAVQAAEARRLAALEEERRTKEKLRRTRTILRTSGWVAVGTGVVVAVTGGIFGGLSLSESSKVEGAPKDTQWVDVKSHYQNADTYRKILYYGTAIGGGVALAGAILVGWSYRSAAAERRPEGGEPAAGARVTALPYAGPQSAGFLLAGQF
jgi:tetratricopeptide (TPR) repeat protein